MSRTSGGPGRRHNSGALEPHAPHDRLGTYPARLHHPRAWRWWLARVCGIVGRCNALSRFGLAEVDQIPGPMSHSSEFKLLGMGWPATTPKHRVPSSILCPVPCLALVYCMNELLSLLWGPRNGAWPADSVPLMEERGSFPAANQPNGYEPLPQRQVTAPCAPAMACGMH